MALNSNSSKAMVVLAVAVVLMALAVTSAAVTCGQVGSSIAPCVPYVAGRATTVSQGCCNGVRSLNSMARTTADRQQACKCLKNLAGTIKALDLGKVAGVPGKCGVSVPFPISMSTNCDKIR